MDVEARNSGGRAVGLWTWKYIALKARTAGLQTWKHVALKAYSTERRSLEARCKCVGVEVFVGVLDAYYCRCRGGVEVS